MNTTYVGEYRRRLSKDDTACARPGRLDASRICNAAASIWRMVVRFLGALDKQMTANLDCRARLMLYGDASPPDARQRRK